MPASPTRTKTDTMGTCGSSPTAPSGAVSGDGDDGGSSSGGGGGGGDMYMYVEDGSYAQYEQYAVVDWRVSVSSDEEDDEEIPDLEEEDRQRAAAAAAAAAAATATPTTPAATKPGRYSTFNAPGTELTGVEVNELESSDRLHMLLQSRRLHAVAELDEEVRAGGELEPTRWNAHYQRALEMPEETKEQQTDKYTLLSMLSQDFAAAAARYGRTIITEQVKPPGSRTVQTAGMGGVAGGTKFIVDGILFKLAQDIKVGCGWLYGGDYAKQEYAQKASGNDLRGAVRIHAVQERLSGKDGVKLRVPLQLVIDFRGWRLLAMPILPLKKLLYGSRDSGVTVHRSSESLNSAIAELAEDMHLAEHVVGSHKAKLHTAGDVEGHEGKDGRFYLLDLARLSPPEAEAQARHLPRTPSHAHAVFFRLLRPELLNRIKQETSIPALNADAFTNWSRHEPEHMRHMADCRRATAYMLQTVVPEFAQFLESSVTPANETDYFSDLIIEAHKRGINARHLGLVRFHLQRPNSPAGRVLLIEVLKRTLKNLLRAELRRATQYATRPDVSDFEAQDTCVNFLNMISGRHELAEQFWREHVLPGIVLRFGSVALASFAREQDASVPDRDHSTVPDEAAFVYDAKELSDEVRSHPLLGASPLGMLHVIEYVVESVGLRLSSKCRSDCLRATSLVGGFAFCTADVEDGKVRTKQMPILGYAEGRMLQLIGDNLVGAAGHNAHSPAARLYAMSSARYEAALQSDATSVSALLAHVSTNAHQFRLLRRNAQADVELLGGVVTLLSSSSPQADAGVKQLLSQLAEAWLKFPQSDVLGGASSLEGLDLLISKIIPRLSDVHVTPLARKSLLKTLRQRVAAVETLAIALLQRRGVDQGVFEMLCAGVFPHGVPTHPPADVLDLSVVGCESVLDHISPLAFWYVFDRSFRDDVHDAARSDQQVRDLATDAALQLAKEGNVVLAWMLCEVVGINVIHKALLYECALLDENAVKSLLESEADLYHVDAESGEGVVFGVLRGLDEVLDAGADPQQAQEAVGKAVATLDTLFAFGAQADARNRNLETPLMVCLQLGHPMPVVQRLLSAPAGCLINHRTPSGESALSRLLATTHPPVGYIEEVYDALLAHGFRATPLDLAALHEVHASSALRVLETLSASERPLREHAIDVMLHVALARDELSLFDAVVALLPPERADKLCFEVLCEAVFHSALRCLLRLLEMAGDRAKAACMRRDKAGRTVLHWAVLASSHKQDAIRADDLCFVDDGLCCQVMEVSTEGDVYYAPYQGVEASDFATLASENEHIFEEDLSLADALDRDQWLCAPRSRVRAVQPSFASGAAAVEEIMELHLVSAFGRTRSPSTRVIFQLQALLDLPFAADLLEAEDKNGHTAADVAVRRRLVVPIAVFQYRGIEVDMEQTRGQNLANVHRGHPPSPLTHTVLAHLDAGWVQRLRCDVERGVLAAKDVTAALLHLVKCSEFDRLVRGLAQLARAPRAPAQHESDVPAHSYEFKDGLGRDAMHLAVLANERAVVKRLVRVAGGVTPSAEPLLEEHAMLREVMSEVTM